jgi:hypothetical protein
MGTLNAATKITPDLVTPLTFLFQLYISATNLTAAGMMYWDILHSSHIDNSFFVLGLMAGSAHINHVSTT